MTYDAKADGEQSYLAARAAQREKALAAIKREVVIGDCRLLLGDCEQILPGLGAFHAIVTDPPYGIDYMGSGTTGIACTKQGFRFTGIERDPSYFEVAIERITEAHNAPDMFHRPPRS